MFLGGGGLVMPNPPPPKTLIFSAKSAPPKTLIFRGGRISKRHCRAGKSRGKPQFPGCPNPFFCRCAATGKWGSQKSRLFGRLRKICCIPRGIQYIMRARPLLFSFSAFFFCFSLFTDNSGGNQDGFCVFRSPPC